MWVNRDKISISYPGFGYPKNGVCGVLRTPHTPFFGVIRSIKR